MISAPSKFAITGPPSSRNWLASNTTRYFRTVLFLVLCFSSISSIAGTYVSRDLTELRWAFYYLVVLVILIAVVFSTQSGGKLLLLYVGIPALFIIVDIGLKRNRQAQYAEHVRTIDEGAIRDVVAFSEFCKTGQRKIFAKVPPSPKDEETNDGILAIRIHKSDESGEVRVFNAYSVAKLLQQRPKECAQSGLKFIESENESKARSFSACQPGVENEIPYVSARYEIVFGESITKETLPWEGYGQRWMSKVSVRILDRRGGHPLAEDYVFFLGSRAKNSECQATNEKLLDLVYEVFDGTPSLVGDAAQR